MKITQHKLDHLRSLCAGRLPIPVIELHAETIIALIDHVEQLEEAQQRHLRLIRRMSTESVSPEQAEELREQIAALIAEVGTKRAEEKFGMSGVLCSTCGANIGGGNNCETCVGLFGVEA